MSSTTGRVIAFVFAFARTRLSAFAHTLVPDLHDARYPCPWWFSVGCDAFQFWWLGLLVYLGYVLTTALRWILQHGFNGIGQTAWLAHVLLLDRVIPVLSSHPWFAVPTVAVAGLVLTLWRRALEDHEREVRILLLRIVYGPHTRQRVKTVGLFGLGWVRQKVVVVGLLLVSTTVGVVLGMLKGR